MTHQSIGNEVTPDGIVHRCSCGWVSRPCFSNMIASLEGQEHRDAAARAAGVSVPPATFDEWWRGTGYVYGRETAREAWDAALGVTPSHGGQP